MNADQAASALRKLEGLRRRHLVAVATVRALVEREQELQGARRRLLREQEELQRAHPRHAPAPSLGRLQQQREQLRASLGAGPAASRQIREEVPDHTLRIAAIALSLRLIEEALADLRAAREQIDAAGIGDEFHSAQSYLQREAGLFLAHHMAEKEALLG